MGLNPNVRDSEPKRRRGSVHLPRANVVLAEQHLAMQIRELDDIIVDEADGADTGARKCE
jgi:hypothetical protein